MAHLLPWHLVTCYFQNITREEFKAIKGPGVTGRLVQCLKEIICIFLQVNNIDPDSHVIQDYDKTTLNHKRRVRGEKFLHSDSSTAGSSTSGSLTSGSSSSDSSSSLSLYFASQPTCPLGTSRNQIQRNLQQLLGRGRLHAASSSSHP